MRKIVVSVILVVLLLAAGLLITKNNKSLLSTSLETPTPTVMPSVTVTPEVTMSPENTKSTNSYNVEWIIVRDPKKVELYSNSTEKLTSADAKTKYNCINLISGGFWREDNGEPLGLFITEGKELHASVESSLLDGYFYIEDDQTFNISAAIPASDTISLALQAGPILYSDSLPTKVDKVNEGKDRRIVVAKTIKGEIVFMVFYYKPSPLSGPLLSDLPVLLNDLYKTSNLKVESALNLDGGTHSAFITDNVNITEVARIGSFFCVKP